VNRTWNLIATDPPNWWILELEASRGDKLLAEMATGRYRLRPSVTGPGYVRLLMEHDSPGMVEFECDQARWLGLL
jgi:hypothetical protein